MSTPPLALSNIVDVTVTVAPAAAVAPNFNQGLFIGNSGVIPSYGANSRLLQFSSTTAILAAGFLTSDPEYIAAQIYFSQTPVAQFIWIGCQDPTSLQTITLDGRTVTDGAITATADILTSATAAFVSGDVGSAVIVAGAGAAGAALVTTIASVTNGTTAVLVADASTTVTAAQTSIGALGSGYHANDIVTVTQAGATYGEVKVLTVGIDGQVLTAVVLGGSQGTGYTVASALPTAAVSPATGTGFKVNITAVGETLLQAATACRAAGSVWYGLAVANPADADNLALAAWADALWQNTRYYAWTNDVAVPNGTANNVALQIQALNYRTFGIYATTQSGLYPNNIYAAAGVMGVDMGFNTGLANSFFTLSHKQIAGIAYEPITQTQYSNIKNASWNVYGDFGGQYELLEPGLLSNGSPSFLWLFLAMLSSNIQIDTLDVLAGSPVVPQTNAGEQSLINATNQACAFLASIGFLAGAVWQGTSIPIPSASNPGLVTGQALPAGYLCLAAPYATQSQADRDAGLAMPIYVAVTTAGAVLSLVIGVYVEL
jgi:hypothetical protein